MRQRTWRNPPSTNHERPAERKFYVWQDQHITYHPRRRGWERHPWRWLCTLCDPPSYGFRVREGAWRAIMATSMPHHFRVRAQHHAYVKRTRGR